MNVNPVLTNILLFLIGIPHILFLLRSLRRDCKRTILGIIGKASPASVPGSLVFEAESRTGRYMFGFVLFPAALAGIGWLFCRYLLGVSSHMTDFILYGVLAYAMALFFAGLSTFEHYAYICSDVLALPADKRASFLQQRGIC